MAKYLNTRKLSKKRLLILAAVVVAGLFAWRLFIYKSNNGRDSSTVQKGTVREEMVLTGQIMATEHAQLSFLTNGELAWIGVSEGVKVTKGQALARLDTAKTYQAYEQAKANLRAAEATLARVYDDVQGHSEDESFIQRESRTAAEAAKDSAYRAVVAAQHDLNNSILYAPFSGTVTSVTNPFSGVNTAFTQPQIELVNPDTLYFSVVAEQTEVIKLRVGEPVRIVLDAFPDTEVTGTVSYISYTPVGGEIGSVYNVKVLIDRNAIGESSLRVGMTGDAIFVLEQKENVLFVAPEFIRSDDKGQYLSPGKEKIYIETGIEGEERIEIIDNAVEGLVVYD